MRCRSASAAPKSRAASGWLPAPVARPARHSRMSGTSRYALLLAAQASASWASRSPSSGSPSAIAIRARTSSAATRCQPVATATAASASFAGRAEIASRQRDFGGIEGALRTANWGWADAVGIARPPRWRRVPPRGRRRPGSLAPTRRSPSRRSTRRDRRRPRAPAAAVGPCRLHLTVVRERYAEAQQADRLG